MLDITFDEGFGAILKSVYHLDVLVLPLELQAGCLTRLTNPNDTFWQWRANETMIPGRQPHETATALYTNVRRQIEKLSQKLEAQTPLRVWTTQNVDDYLGLAWLCAQTRGKQIKIEQVSLPTIEIFEGEAPVLYAYSRPGERDPDKLQAYFAEAVPISPSAQEAYANEWHEQVSLGGELRTIINGMLVNVPETFYDDLLRRVWTPGELRPATIGKVIGSYAIGVPDWWWLHRLLVTEFTQNTEK